MAKVLVTVSLSAEERTLLSEAANRSLVQGVLNDLAKTITAGGSPIGDLARANSKPPSLEQIEEAISGLTTRRDNLLALPETAARADAVTKIEDAVSMLRGVIETMNDVPDNLRAPTTPAHDDAPVIPSTPEGDS